MRVHLLDGTYELFRQFFGQPSRAADDGVEIGAARGVVLSMMSRLADGATHLGVATDHVIESFRNDLWPGYKTGSGIDPLLRAQFVPLEEALDALARRSDRASDVVRLHRAARASLEGDAQVTTAQCSEVNIVLPPEEDEGGGANGGDRGGDDDGCDDFGPKELPVPEQFVTRVVAGRLVTEPVAHSGA